jgi:hypothetical protein
MVLAVGIGRANDAQGWKQTALGKDLSFRVEKAMTTASYMGSDAAIDLIYTIRYLADACSTIASFISIYP